MMTQRDLRNAIGIFTAAGALACGTSATTTEPAETPETAEADTAEGSPEATDEQADLAPAAGEGDRYVHTIEFPELDEYETRNIPMTLDPPLPYCELPEAFFAEGKKKALPRYDLELMAVAQCLQSEPYTDKDIDVVGYTDPSGSAESNKALGMDRAEYVKKTLVQYGVDPERIHVESKGEQAANEATGESSPGYYRRVDLILTDLVVVPSY